MSDWSRKSFTKDEFRAAWMAEVTRSDVARRLGLTPAGGTISRMSHLAEELNLSNTHMIGKGSHGGGGPRHDLKDILVQNSSYSTSNLRRRLLKEGVKQHICEMCIRTEWNDKPIPLELDHINGDNRDHRIENLRILCPNCHAQTDTYCGKNTEICRSRKVNPKPVNLCIDCGTEIHDRSRKCRTCHAVDNAIKRRVVTIDKEELTALLDSVSWNFVRAGKVLGISDNAVRKWCIKYSIPHRVKDRHL